MKVNKDKDIDNETKQKFNEWKYNVKNKLMKEKLFN